MHSVVFNNWDIDMIDDYCKPLLERANINTFIETGLFMGETVATVSRWFAAQYGQFGRITGYRDYGQVGPNPWNTSILYPTFDSVLAVDQLRVSPKVISIELNPAYVDVATTIFADNPNIHIINGSSEEILKKLVPDLNHPEVRPFFYLDAHWDEYWPIKDELELISQLSHYFIVIDDFQVPGQPSWGFDSYKGVPLSTDLILPHLGDLSEIQVHFPHRSNRDNRGFVVITKGYQKENACLFDGLPFSQAELGKKMTSFQVELKEVV